MNELRDDRSAGETVPGDDRIIGKALRISLAVMMGVILVGAAVWLLLQPDAAVTDVEEAVPIAAKSAPGAKELVPPEVPFTDITQSAGIDFVHVNGAYGERLLPETMGGGVAFLDYDNDGWQDLLFVNSNTWPWHDDARQPVSALYRNAGNGRFDNVTAGSGLDQLDFYGMGTAVADFDGDGFRDIFLTAVGRNHLLKNVGGEHFVDVTESAGVGGAEDTWSTGAAFFDYDRDGDLDLIVCNYVQWSRDIDLAVDYRLTGIGRAYGPPNNYAGTWSYLYRNNGDGTFTDVSNDAGINVDNPATGLPAGKALAVLPLDVDRDGWLDLIVANDTVQNFLFMNNTDGTFEEVGMSAGIAFDNAGKATGAMGIDAAHDAGDATVSVAIGNFANEMSSFYVSRGTAGLFTDEAIVSGIGPESRSALSFGLFFFDYDLDGRLDLLQTNGHVEDEINVVQPSQHYEQPTQLFWNCGSACARHYVPVQHDALGDLTRPVVGRGAAYGDIDNDGDLDVLITQVGRPPLALRNDQALGHNWLRVKVEGSGSNTDAIGAQVEAAVDGIVQTRTVMPTRSYLSQVELPVTFGLGNRQTVDRLTITWPDGQQVTSTDVPANQTLIIPPPEP